MTTMTNSSAGLFTGLLVLGAVSCASTQESTPTAGAMAPKAIEASASTDAGAGVCPVMHGPAAALASAPAPEEGYQSNGDWWPNMLNLDLLKQNPAEVDPMGGAFDYAAAYANLDLDEVKADIEKVMTTSQDWWPADWGHYGPFFIRMAWHSAGTYRVGDGRGGSGDGNLRFAPHNSWPDNANLDKARRLLWPIKKKYGKALSWADLMILTGNVAFESSGLEMFGFAGGRDDVWEPQDDVFWGPEAEWLADARYHGDRQLADPLAAVQMGLIYVNPEGPNGNPDPLAAARDIRETFGRMAMNDEETVALIAGGHTLGKAHGAANPGGFVGPEPEGASLEEQGFGWTSTYGKGSGGDAITSGLEGAWTSTPIEWSNGYFENLFGYEWELTQSPAGAKQWTSKDGVANVPDAHDPDKFNKPMMLTTDLALRMDPAYEKISRRFLEDPAAFNLAFAKAWYKLTHRDMGPVARLLGDEVAPAQIWQDPVPAVDHTLIDGADAKVLAARIMGSGLTVSELVGAAWASASSYRDSDKRGGANGARVRLAPQKDWAANDPAQLAKVLGVLEGIQAEFNAAQPGNKKVSMADLIVLGGAAAVQSAAEAAGFDVAVPFAPGRTDATAEMTDAASFDVLEPRADGFRNYVGSGLYMRSEEALVDKANLLGLTAPEMTVLVGGLRVLGANSGGSDMGVLTAREGTLTNDFFVNLLDMGTRWQLAKGSEDVYEGYDRATGDLRWRASAVDLVFGANGQLRGLAEHYASDDAREMFVRDFVAAWHKVMMLDRFDIKR